MLHIFGLITFITNHPLHVYGTAHLISTVVIVCVELFGYPLNSLLVAPRETCPCYKCLQYMILFIWELIWNLEAVVGVNCLFFSQRREPASPHCVCALSPVPHAVWALQGSAALSSGNTQHTVTHLKSLQHFWCPTLVTGVVVLTLYCNISAIFWLMLI